MGHWVWDGSQPGGAVEKASPHACRRGRADRLAAAVTEEARVFRASRVRARPVFLWDPPGGHVSPLGGLGRRFPPPRVRP